jgi:hypothetical protein
MKVSPPTVRCAFCANLFLPPEVSAWNVVQCPHCGSQMPLDECRPAQPEPQQRRVVIQVTEEEARAHETRRQQQQHLIALTVAGSVVAAVAVGFIVVLGVSGRRPAPSPGSASAAPAPDQVRQEQQKLDAAFVVASRALASEDWTSALPFLRRAGRIEPLMQRYHNDRPWNHVTLTRRSHARLVNHEGATFAEIEAESASGKIVHLQLEETPDGWKLDWESLVNAPGLEWQQFYNDRPDDARRLRVTAQWASLPDAYYLSAGCEPSKTLAVRLWGTEPGDSVVALVPRDSPLGRTLATEISWDIQQQYVAEIRFADPQAVPPRVNFIAILQKNWLLRD